MRRPSPDGRLIETIPFGLGLSMPGLQTKNNTMSLDYLDFDYSEDEQGHGTFDAMASTNARRVAAVRAEIAQVLDWAHEAFPNLRAPLDEGGEWDYQLEGQQEWSAHEAISYDEVTGKFTSQLSPAGEPRHTVSLSISGSPQFCEAFRQRFGVE